MIRANRQPFDADLATAYRPFEGDETDTTLLSDKIVRAAKLHPHCQTCHGLIEKGERHRAYTERNNEEHKIMTFRFCGLCCTAEAIEATFPHRRFSAPDRLIMSRYLLGHRRREQARQAAATEGDHG